MGTGFNVPLCVARNAGGGRGKYARLVQCVFCGTGVGILCKRYAVNMEKAACVCSGFLLPLVPIEADVFWHVRRTAILLCIGDYRSIGCVTTKKMSFVVCDRSGVLRNHNADTSLYGPLLDIPNHSSMEKPAQLGVDWDRAGCFIGSGVFCGVGVVQLSIFCRRRH